MLNQFLKGTIVALVFNFLFFILGCQIPSSSESFTENSRIESNISTSLN